MANFAKAQLLKYGWTEGKGLGKNENGIKDPVKANLKFDTAGIGHKETDLNWWENAFNEAAKNISVKSDTGSVCINVQKKNAEPEKKPLAKKKSNNTLYGNFLKTSTLCDGRMVGGNVTTEEPDKPSNFNISILSDEELLRVCEGRTAHKGARHGLNLSGKLERIAKQEQELLELTSLRTWNKSKTARRKEAKEMNNLSKVLSKSCKLSDTESIKLPECETQKEDIDITVINTSVINDEAVTEHKSACHKKKKKSKNSMTDNNLMDRFVHFSLLMDNQFRNPSEMGKDCTNSGDSNKKRKRRGKRRINTEESSNDNGNGSVKDISLNFKVKKRKCGEKSDNIDLADQLNRVSLSENSCSKNKSDSEQKNEEVLRSRKKKKKRRHTISEDVQMTEAHKLNNRICKKKKSCLRNKEKAAKMEWLARCISKELKDVIPDIKTSAANKSEIVAGEFRVVSFTDNS